MIRERIAKGVTGEDLREAAMMAVMTEIMEGEATPAQSGAFKLRVSTAPWPQPVR
jgi:anthranilate phosphoribosyltransferase